MPREPSKEDLEDLKVGRLLEEMLASDGWKLYEKLLTKHLVEKRDAALTPIAPKVQNDGSLFFPDGVTHVLLGEAAKGAIIGIRLALELPRGIIAQMQSLRAEIVPAKKDEL